MLWRVTPFSGVQFLVWDVAHSQLEAYPAFQRRQTLAAFVAGALAGVSATVVTYPLDLLRARQAVGYPYRNYPGAIEEILRADGVRGLFKGLSPTIIGMVPYSAISFGTFDALKGKLRAWHGVGSDAEIPMLERLAAGGVCGVASQLIAFPMHTVRRRMQVLPTDEIGASGSLAYATTHEALLEIRSKEGIAKGLFKSLSLTWLKGPLTVGVAFVTNDVLKAFLCEHNRRSQGDQFAPLPASGYFGATDNNRAGSARQLQAIDRLVCGGIAGSLAKTVIAPGDRIKILFQTDHVRRFSWQGVWDTARDIVRSQGPRGLWRGHGATLLRVAPYSATSFAVFDPYKGRIRELAPGLGEIYVRFLAGAGAGMTATALTYPFDLFRARMAAHQGREGRYDGYLRAAMQVVRTEGPLALFSGLRPTLLGIVPYSGITFCLYETFKSRLQKSQAPGAGAELSSGWRLCAGALSGLLAQSATYPLDVVRRRMQVHPNMYRHEAHALASIFRDEGRRGLYKGLSMNWIKGPIAVAVSFATNDFLRDVVSRV
mmetsp:Transcript_96327/g.277414  ORF Transcript_96327/g.277414 Transcript_96327/m.277414 type:complete len:543 (+) Transcript_96327:2-1630(+)